MSVFKDLTSVVNQGLDAVNKGFSDSVTGASQLVSDSVNAVGKGSKTAIDESNKVANLVLHPTLETTANLITQGNHISEYFTGLANHVNSDLFTFESLILALSAITVGTFAFPPVSIGAGCLVVALTFFNGWIENNEELKNTVEDLYKNLYKAFIFLDTDLFKKIVLEGKLEEDKLEEDKLTEEEINKIIELINKVKENDQIKKELPDDVKDILLIMETLKNIYDKSYFPMTLFPSNYQTSLTFATQRLFNCFTTLYENSEEFKEIIRLFNKYNLFDEKYRKKFFEEFLKLNKDLIASASEKMQKQLEEIVDKKLDIIQEELKKETKDKAHQGGYKTKKRKTIKKKRKTIKKKRKTKKLKTIKKRRKNKKTKKNNKISI